MDENYDLAIESFMEYLDEMMIAEEGDVFIPPVIELMTEVNAHIEKIFKAYIKITKDKDFFKLNRTAPRVTSLDSHLSKKNASLFFDIKGPEKSEINFLNFVCMSLNENMTMEKGYPYKSWTTGEQQLIVHW